MEAKGYNLIQKPILQRVSKPPQDFLPLSRLSALPATA